MAAREAYALGGVRDHVWALQTKIRRFANLARCVARRSRAPYRRRWALIIALARIIHERARGDRAGAAAGAGGWVRLSPSRPARRRHSGEGVGARRGVTGTGRGVV